MKKIFTLFASALVATTVMAQAPGATDSYGNGYQLSDNCVIKTYVTYDGTSMPNDDNHTLSGAFLKSHLNFPFELNSSKDPKDTEKPFAYMNKISLTQDYYDEEGNVSIPRGDYTAFCGYSWWRGENDYDDNKMDFSFHKDADGKRYISNIKKVILYVAGTVPGSSTASSASDYKEIKISTTRMFNEGKMYENAVGGTEATKNFLSKPVHYGMPAGGVIVDAEKREFSQAGLFKFVIDYATPHDPDYAQTDILDNNGNTVSTSVNTDDYPEEKTKLAGMVDGTGHATADEYRFCMAHKYVDKYGDYGTQAKGFHTYDLSWSKNVGYEIQVKQYGYVMAVAFICGNDNPKTYEANASDSKNATWKEVGTTAINTVNAANAAVAAPAKSIENGRVVISKNGHKYTAAGAMLK